MERDQIIDMAAHELTSELDTLMVLAAGLGDQRIDGMTGDGLYFLLQPMQERAQKICQALDEPPPRPATGTEPPDPPAPDATGDAGADKDEESEGGTAEDALRAMGVTRLRPGKG